MLGALAIVCAARPVLAVLPSIRLAPRKIAALGTAGLAAYAGALIVAGVHTRPDPQAAQPAAQVARLPQVVIAPSRGVDSKLDRHTARQIAADLQRRRPQARVRRVTLWLETGPGQGAVIVARLQGPGQQAKTVEVALSPSGYRIARVRRQD